MKTDAHMSSKVKVAVRVRPLNRREIDMNTDIVVDMDKTQTYLKAPKLERKQPKTFTFDHCFWSMDENNEKFASQEYVYDCLGKEVVENGFEGYNGCIFAYGQTGSGKSYTMMGAVSQKGLIPRICDDLFERIAKIQSEDTHSTNKVEVSYMEIYNEKVRDLLCPKSDKQNLKVREHKVLGPYVDGLSKLVVNSYSDIENLMNEGNKSRTVAATMMNAESSRSHAVFNVVLTQSQYDPQTEATGEKVSKLSLVDLAGSERVSKTGAAGDRLKEGGNINKSLTTLGLVISVLADQAAGKAKKGSFVPYRDSVLTWLLKDNLGGNSKTVMVATVSPAADNFEETLSTLRYADRAKRIENHAVVNEDPNAKIIRELREEVERLRELLTSKAIDASLVPRTGRQSTDETGEIKEMLEESEKLMQEASLTWEQKERQTEQIHKERHRILEEMGICLQDSGIGVREGRYYLVNLNADPSLNELLVYYLKDHTKIGRHESPVLQDIQLSGLGILSEHCKIDIEDDVVYIEPAPDARTCINGQVITSRTQLRHGDRILWGNNHFFRLNCPHVANISQGTELDQTLDFDFAQNELMLNEFDSLGEPIQNIIKQLEEHHEQEKQGALEKQRQMYEEKLEELRREKTPDVRSDTPPLTDGRGSLSTSGYGSRMSFGSVVVDEREIAYEEGLRKLREEVLKANVLVREANQLSEEMKRETDFTVTLQIPTASLSPGRNRAPLTSEVAIVVKHKLKGTQVWSVEKLANKIFDMRDLYQQSMAEGGDPQSVDMNSGDNDGLFFEVECHTLIGVATVWLECLYQDVPLDYAAPIISQQGEVCGKIAVDIRRLYEKPRDDVSLSSDGSFEEERENLELGTSIQVQVTITEATGLPPVLSNYVFCQYNFFDQPLTVVPPMNVAPSPVGTKTNSMLFNHTQVMTFEVTEEFIDYVSDGSLAIEVYGNRSKGFDSSNRLSWTKAIEQDPDRSLSESPLLGLSKVDRVRWNELIRHVEMYVEIHELNEQGTFAPVELQTRDGTECGGIFQLRQGFSRRIQTQIVVPKSGQLPVVCGRIVSVAIGSVNVRAKIQKGLDSYQEHDLQRLRDKWSNSLLKRREYLDQQIQDLISKSDKTQGDKERESALIDQWVSLTEERNTVLCPTPGTGVPGAPKDWEPPQGMESKTPVIFLDLDENMLVGISDVEPESAGVKCLLPFELPERMIDIPIMTYDQKKVLAIAPWDSSLHDSVYLNRVTQNNERIYLILKVTIRLTSPVPMMVVLRKRICVRMYKRPSIKESLKKKFLRPTNIVTKSGVTFELVSHIPRQSGDETEERENLAKKAAAAMRDSEELVDGDVIEKYNKGVSNVENILNLHKLRQEVLVKEKLAASGRSTKSLRKFASTPNLAHLTGAQSLTNLWRSGNFGSNTDLRRSPEQSSTQEVRSASLEVPQESYGARSSSIGSSGVVLRQARGGVSAKSNPNRHSFYGFESPRLIQTAEINIDTVEDMKPESSTFISPAGYITSTPRGKNNSAQLQPLIEDEGPPSPVRSPKDKNAPEATVLPETDGSKNVSRSLMNELVNEPVTDGTGFADPLGATRKLSETRRLSDASRSAPRRSSRSSRSSESEETSHSGENLDIENELARTTNPEQQGSNECRRESKTTICPEEQPNHINHNTHNESVQTDALKVGHVVDLGGGKLGTVRFRGKTEFADGEWFGVELNAPEGKNDGSVKGVSYFSCPPNRGLFIRADKLLSALAAQNSLQ